MALLPRISRSPALLLAGLFMAASCSGVVSEDEQRNAGGSPPVILIVIDTLRADHLSCYGYRMRTSPEIDELAARSHLFLSNSTQCNSTRPSITSIMTGVYPRTHRDYIPVPVEGAQRQDESFLSLAERMREGGYRTYAVWSHPTWTEKEVTPSTPLRRGWDSISMLEEKLDREERMNLANAGFTNRRALAMLDLHEREGGGAPPFLYVHYFDPHTPYQPPAPHTHRFLSEHLDHYGIGHLEEELSRFEILDRKQIRKSGLPPGERSMARMALGRSLYDGEIRYTSKAIGELTDELARRGLLDDSLIVLMADHGENMEDGARGGIAFSHARLYEGVTQTPLLIKLPGQREGQRIEAITQNIDVLPTLVELLGLPRGPAVEGASLAPLIADPSGSLHEQVFVESSDHLEKAVRTAGLKYIEPEAGERPLLFRWRSDPGERTNLADSAAPALLEKLRASLEEFRPRNSLRLRLAPEAVAYELTLELELAGGAIEEVAAPPGGELGEGGTRYRWRGRVESEHVELCLFLNKRQSDIRFRIIRTDGTPMLGRIHLGQVLLEDSTAIPLPDITGTASDPEPERSDSPTASVVKEGETLEILLQASDPAALEIEFHRMGNSYGRTVELLEQVGFDFADSVPDRRGVLALSAKSASAARARVRVTDPTEVLTLVRIDGSWPDLSLFSIDGMRVASEPLGFVFHNGDGRLMGNLLAGPVEEAPAGSVSIWFEGGVGPVEIDTAHLNLEEVEELRALGYVR